MDASKDYYAVLGVLPSAEDVVIRAAYRALAQRYHPDRPGRNTAAAHVRMVEINEANSVLSDPAARASYDHQRGAGTQSADAYFDERRPEESADFDPLEKDWALAANYYSDLSIIESRLARISWRLAYSYRAYLLESKRFSERSKIASIAETQFLKTYFGENSQIVEFARSLIQAGHRAPAKALNEAARVLGPGIEAGPVISKISVEFGLHKLAETERRKAEILRRAQAMRENRRTPIDEKVDLLQQLGGSFHWDKGFFKSSCRAKFNTIEYTFTDGEAFSQWIDKEILPQILNS